MLNTTNAAIGLPAGERRSLAALLDTAGELTSLTRGVWFLIVAMAGMAMVSFWLLGLSINASSNQSLIGIAIGYAGMVWFYRRMRPDPLIAGPAEAVGQLFIVLFLGLLLTYAATATALPYRDAELNAIDAWMGFERQSFRGMVAAVPGLSGLLDLTYLSIHPQTALIPFILIMARQLPRLLRFVLALGFALSMTSLIAVFVPAISASIYLDLAPLREAGIPPDIYTHIPTLQALRSGAMTEIRLNDVEGLITFPSFHTAIAILFAWALWRVPVVRWLGLVVNALMILSTPLSGSHYVIDLVGGTMVATVAIIAANRIGHARIADAAVLAGRAPQFCS